MIFLRFPSIPLSTDSEQVLGIMIMVVLRPCHPLAAILGKGHQDWRCADPQMTGTNSSRRPCCQA